VLIGSKPPPLLRQQALEVEVVVKEKAVPEKQRWSLRNANSARLHDLIWEYKMLTVSLELNKEYKIIIVSLELNKEYKMIIVSLEMNKQYKLLIQACQLFRR